MADAFAGLPFRPADILLPQNCDMTKWSVVACDQYTSQPEYWQRVEDLVGSAPSSLRLILPESCLDGPSIETDIIEINNTMTRYLREHIFRTLPDALLYVERTQSNGEIRRGLIGKVDLDQYDYEPGSDAQVRATEGVVLSRIPPRVAVRKNAPLELPHAMLLADDPEQTVIAPLSGQKDQMEPLYDFELMEGGGHLTGWKLNQAQKEQVAKALQALADPARFHARYGVPDQLALLFAVGDGNHSLATAKECYERQKRLTPPDQWAKLPARYALTELVNLYDSALTFEPIHRVVFGAHPDDLLNALLRFYPGAHFGQAVGHAIRCVCGEREETITVPNPAARLAVETLQLFLDQYIRNSGGRIDYIHGEQVARELARRPDTTCFLLPPMDKTQLYPAVIHDGILPRKTFSIGQASDKRFYLEARRIRI